MDSTHTCTVPVSERKTHDSIWGGLILAFTIASAAFAVGHIPGFQFVSPMILAVFLGILFQSVFTIPASFSKGITFSLHKLLKIGIVLLGLQLSFAQVFAVGWNGLLAIFLTLGSTFLFCLWAGKRLGVDPRLTRLIAAGTSICGASAIVATNSVIRGKDEHVAYAITTVTLFGFLSMLLFPVAGRLLALDPATFGFWSGSSIHETAQVIGTAFQGGQVSGETGTVTKLSRILFLVPVILILGFFPIEKSQLGTTSKKRLPIPWLIIGFMILVAINSFLTLEPVTKEQIKFGNKFLLTVALAAMGLQMSFAKIKETGMRPLCLGALAWIFVSIIGLVLAKTLV